MNKLARRAVIRYSMHNRRRKAERITAWMDGRGIRTAAFVGSSPGTNPNEQIVERAIAEHATVVWACDILDSPNCPWPFRLADARDLPEADGSVDMLLANAVIEHVGGEADQRRMVSEMCRVGGSWVMTTPNRWFPVESHTAVAFKHWSKSWRQERREFTRLLSRSEFTALLPPGAEVHGRPWSSTFTAYWAP